MRTLFIDENFNLETLDPSMRTLYNMYVEVREKKSEFHKFLHLKVKNFNLWVQKCIDLCKSVKCITFRKDRAKFEVRITRNGKKFYLGSHDSFDDACSTLETFINQLNS